MKTIGKMGKSISARDSIAHLPREVISLASECAKQLQYEIEQPGRFLIEVPPAESLALKSDLQFPWTKLREDTYGP